MADSANDLEALTRRIAALESSVRALSEDVARLDARSAAEPVQQAAAAMPPQKPAAPATAASQPQPLNWLPLPKQVDFESLIGRYGTLVLATVSALAAVGTFIGWAIANGLLGPTQRIALGLIVAAGLGISGIRLRKRERSFGASLLGLALAVIHVCAWGAGPSLHLVPEWGAFLLAAIASIALAVFANGEVDEPLWSVGFSGAAIAPFVTSSGRGNLALLAAYGVAVLGSAGYAMGGRRWIVAGRLFLLAAAAYTTALATGFERQLGPLYAMGFPLAVGVLGVIPWIAGLERRERLRALGVLAGLAAVRSAVGINLPLDDKLIASLIAGAGVIWLVFVDRTHAVAEPPSTTTRRLHEGDWLDAAVIPLAFVLAAVMALDGSARQSGLAMTAAAATVLVTVMRLPQGSLRDAAAFSVLLCSLVALLLLEQGHPLLLTSSIAALSTMAFAANLAWRSASWTILASIGLGWCVLASLGHLATRTPYDYTPFATQQSAVAAVVLACAVLARRLAGKEQGLVRVLAGGVLVWAFLWVHQEIALAFNQTAATLLRVSYYAATSVAAVGAGRARSVAILRHAGLALAVLAAGTALYGARGLDAIGARIGADLVAAVFLLAIAYWYRRPGSARPSEAT